MKKYQSILFKNPEYIPKVIYFYRPQGDFGYLSNFCLSPFQKNKKTYRTVEHYYQSQKFKGHQMEDVIIEAQTPAQAFRLGRTANLPLKQNWQKVKQQKMWEGLSLKFEQNQNLAKLLMQTGQSKLVQHTDRDKFWGDGGNGNGQNRLGILLMILRDVLLKGKGKKENIEL